MRILVIGGNGFIGSPLVTELLGSGHVVAVFHRRYDAGLAGSEVVVIQDDPVAVGPTSLQMTMSENRQSVLS